MQILGDIGEMREIAEGADDGQRLGGRERAQQRVELLIGLHVAIAADGDGQAADGLDPLEGGDALLIAHRVAEQTAEQANVGEQRLVAERGGGAEIGGVGFDLHVGRRSSEARPGAVGRGW